MSLKLDFSVLAKPDVTAQILNGIVTMMELTALAWLLAMVVGTVLATLRMSGNRWAEGSVAA